MRSNWLSESPEADLLHGKQVAETAGAGSRQRPAAEAGFVQCSGAAIVYLLNCNR